MLKQSVKRVFLFSFVFIVAALIINITAEPAFGKEKKQTKPTQQKKEATQNRVISEKLIGKISGDVSPDGKRIAYVNKVYIPKIGNKQFVVVDEKEGEKYDEIMGDIHFSPDSKRFAYAAKKEGKTLVVVDGKESRQFEKNSFIFTLLFSPDSTRIAYLVGKGMGGADQILVIDEKEINKYDRYYGITFSPDSKRIAYVTKELKKRGDNSPAWFVVVNDEEGKRYMDIEGFDNKGGFEGLTFSPDSKHLAYIANIGRYGRSRELVVVVDGNEEGVLSGVKGLIFSPDSKRLAYKAWSKAWGNGWFVVVDGKKDGGPFGQVRDQIFSPDSNRVAYIAEEDRGKFVVINGERMKRYDDVGAPIFSPDSKRIAYAARGAKDHFVVIDEQEGKEYRGVEKAIFSPDSKRLVYVAKKEGKSFVVVDGKEGKKFNRVSTPAFSSDSKHIAYAVEATVKNKRLEFVVVDGKEGKNYDDIVEIKRTGKKGKDDEDADAKDFITFDSPDKFHYIVRKGNNFYLVEEKIK